MIAAEGILTSRGGLVSHAAVVARGMGKPAICGAEAVKIDLKAKQFKAGDVVVKEGDIISISGTTGEIALGEVPVITPEPTGHFATVLGLRRPVPAPQGPHQRRHAGGLGPGPRVRRRRASACAAPSTCSSARTAWPSCGG